MSSQTVRAGYDTWAGAMYPSANHATDLHMALRADNGMGYLWFRSPAPAGATVTRATLTLRARFASSGSRTLYVHRVTSSWKHAGLRWTARPSATNTGRAEKTIGSLAHLSTIEVDITEIVQAWASGAPNYGVRLSTSATAVHYLYGFLSSAKPVVEVEWSDAPAKPSDLRPSEAATSVAKPHVTFTYFDVSGDTELAAVQVQVNGTDSFTSPAFDSGEVPTLEAGLNLASTAYAGISVGATAYWRVRVRDGAGLWSEWSESVSMTRKAKPTVAITNLGAGVVLEPTPPIVWSVSGGTQRRYRVLVFRADELTRPLHDSKELQGTDTAYTIPSGVLKDEGAYRVVVRVWDAENREATPGDPTYAEGAADFTVATDATVGPVTDLTATQHGITPWVDVEWKRSTTPDAFAFVRDGVVAWVRDAAELFVGGTTYRYTVTASRPHFTHEYEVRAIVNGKQSAENPTVSYAVPVEGIWLRDVDRGVDVTLWGDDEGTWKQEDDASVYAPVGSTRVVRIVSGMRGLEGSLTGYLMEGFGKTFAEQEADLLAIKEQPSNVVQLVAGDQSFRALVGNITISPTPKTRAGQIVKAVSFDFWQVGDLGFNPNI